MNRRGWVTAVGLLGLGVSALGLQGCSGGGGGGGSEEPQLGSLSLPLLSQSASGTSYRLRDATFEISSPYWWGTAGSGTGGSAMGGSGPVPQPPIVVDSETDPDAPAITLSLEQGYYEIRLLPGWRMEKVEDGVATPVEAHLLSGDYQYLYVSPQTTTWVEYEFGIGERSVWLNGNVNIGVRVYEDPSERYPYGGMGGVAGGWPGTAGAPAGAGGIGTGGASPATGGTVGMP